LVLTGKKRLDLEKIRFKGDFQKLIHIAQDPKAEQRVEALHQLGIMHTDKVIPVAIQLFRDPDPKVQKAARQALVKLGVNAVPSLITAYKTHSTDVARCIDSTLLSIGPDAADMLIHALSKIDEFSQERVSYVLISMGTSILPKLVHALGLHTGDGKRIIESIIENIGMPSTPYLIDALKNPDEEIRSLAAVELIIAGPKIVPDLLQSCIDDTLEEKELKYYIISQIGTPALDPLYDCIKSSNPVTSAMAIDAFVAFRDSATAPFIVGLFDKDPEIQQSAQDTIVRIGEPIVQALIDEIPRRNELEQEQIVRVLSKIGQNALPAMVNALQHPSAEVTKNMVTGVAAAMGAMATPLLLEKLVYFDKNGEQNIKRVFKLIGRSTLAPLEEAITWPNEKVALFSLGMITDIDPPWAIDPLVTAFNHSNSNIRDMAVSCLLEVGTPAVPRLIGVLNSDVSDVAALAKKTLIAIGDGAVPYLVDAYGKPSGPPEALITDILQQIGSGSLDSVVQLLSAESPRLEIGRSYLIDAGAPAIPAVVTVFDSENRSLHEEGRKVLADIYDHDPFSYIHTVSKLQSPAIQEAYTPIIANEARSLPSLLSLLRCEDGESHIFVHEILRKIGNSLFPPLIEMLRGADEEKTQLISTLLAGYGDSVTLPLIHALHDPELQKAASLTLSKVPSSVPKLIPLLREDTNNMAYYAGSAVAHSDRDGVPILIENFHDDDNPAILAKILSEIGPTAMPPLFSALSEFNAMGMSGTQRFLKLMQCLVVLALADDEQMHVLFGLTHKEQVSIATTAISREGEVVLDPLLQSLMSWKGETPAVAYEICSRMKPAAIEKLHAAIETIPLGNVRKIPVLQLLVSLHDSSSLPFLLKCLEDPSEEIRLAATRNMGTFGRGTLKPLQKAANDKSAAVRAAAVASMGDIGIPALDSLFEALKSKESSIRAVAIGGIAKVGEPAQIMLVQALADKDRDVRKNVVRLLEKISWQPKYTIDKLDYLFAAEDWNGLIKMGPSAIDVLEQGLKDDDEEIRSKSKETLQQIRENLSAR
jgi:HEAT repeat protein